MFGKKVKSLGRVAVQSALAVAALGIADGVAHIGVAQAAETADSGTGASDLVITARRRTEKVQTVPDSVSVVTATALKNADMRIMQDVARVTPNLVIIDQLNPGVQTVSFRGFTTLGVAGAYSPFATVVDGVVQPGQAFSKQNLVDVERIEVLRGPQGTLYGAGAIAGAINVVTKEPTDDLTGDVAVGMYEGKTSQFRGSISGPIIPGLAYFRLGGEQTNSDGLIPNLAGRHGADFIDEHTLNGAVMIHPTDKLSINLRANWTSGFNGALWLVPVPTAQFESYVADPSENIDGVDYRNLQQLSAKVDYDFSKVRLTWITGSNYSDERIHADADYSSAPTKEQNVFTRTNTFNQEFRLASIGDTALKWNVGFFYQDFLVNYNPFFGNQGTPPVWTSNNHEITKRESKAPFGQVSYDFTKKLTLLLGARYDMDDVTDDYIPLSQTNKKSFSQVQPKLSLSYKWTPHVFTYATYSMGYRVGGFNPRAPDSLLIYNNETSENYEAGFKTDFLNNKLTVNAAGFHTKFKNQQYQINQVTPTGIFRVIYNIPETEVNGAELEVIARPIPPFLLQGSVGYNNTEITKFPTNPEYLGNKTPQVYGLTAQIGGTWTQPLKNNFRLVSHLDISHRGEVWWDIANTAKTGPRTFLNGRIALENGDAWYLALIGRNITDERTPAAVSINALGAGTSLASYNEPRQLGVELGAHF